MTTDTTTEAPGEQSTAQAGLQRKSTSTPSPAFMAHRWQPGQSGNHSGKRRGTVSLRSALLRALTRENAETIARALIGKCRGGDVVAIRTLLQALGEWQTSVRLSPGSDGPFAVAVTIDRAAVEARVRSVAQAVVEVDALIDRGLLLAVGGGNGGNGDGGGNGGA